MCAAHVTVAVLPFSAYPSSYIDSSSMFVMDYSCDPSRRIRTQQVPTLLLGRHARKGKDGPAQAWPPSHSLILLLLPPSTLNLEAHREGGSSSGEQASGRPSRSSSLTSCSLGHLCAFPGQRRWPSKQVAKPELMLGFSFICSHTATTTSPM